MNWTEIGKSIASLAPGIGAAVGGPIGAVAGLGIKTICGFFGVDSESPDAKSIVEQAISALSPEQAVELKNIDNQFIKDMKKLDVDVFKLEVEDRGSARTMLERTQSLIPGILSVIVVSGWVVLMYYLFQAPDDFPNKELIMRALGTADAALTGVLWFWFGSSKGSQDKNAIIGRK